MSGSVPAAPDASTATITKWNGRAPKKPVEVVTPSLPPNPTTPIAGRLRLSGRTDGASLTEAQFFAPVGITHYFDPSTGSDTVNLLVTDGAANGAVRRIVYTHNRASSDQLAAAVGAAIGADSNIGVLPPLLQLIAAYAAAPPNMTSTVSHTTFNNPTTICMDSANSSLAFVFTSAGGAGVKSLDLITGSVTACVERQATVSGAVQPSTGALWYSSAAHTVSTWTRSGALTPIMKVVIGDPKSVNNYDTAVRPNGAIGSLLGPKFLVFGKSGNEDMLYITCQGVTRKFNVKTGLLKTIPYVPISSPNRERSGSIAPGGIDTLPNGYLLVTCTHSRSLYTIDPIEGDIMCVAGLGLADNDGGCWDARVYGDAQFDTPTGVTVVEHEQCAYVCDSGRHQIMRVTLPQFLFVRPAKK